MKVGYLIPEFPSHTHVWIWREIQHVREWGGEAHIFSTRRPRPGDRARHGFAPSAEAETFYLHPPRLPGSLELLRWASGRPGELARCLRLAGRLPTGGVSKRLGVIGLIPSARLLAAEAARRGLTHLHSHSCASSALLCMLARQMGGPPYSLTLNANIEWWGGAMREKFEGAEFTVAITRWLLDQIRRDYPSLGPDRSLLARIGVDTRRWVPGPRGPARPGVVRLLTVSRLHPSKGHDVLLDALGILVREGLDVDLRIVGDGPARGDLGCKVEDLGLADRVTFLGSMGEEQVIEQMDEADIFVLASHAEPLGVVYMEAMAMAVATVGTAAGGVGEIICHEEDGLLVPPGDPAALAAALRRLAEDPSLRHRLGRAGRRTIVERFDSRLGARILFDRIAGRRRPGVVPVDVPIPDTVGHREVSGA